MFKSPVQLRVLVVMASAAAGCAITRLTVADGTGPNPMLPAPQRSLVPTVNVVSAKV